MQVIVLGSGTAVPQPFRGPAGYLVRSRNSRILLDCGGGTLQRIARANVELADIDAVFITHPHLDHIGDLPALLFAQRVPGYQRQSDLQLHFDGGMRPWIVGLADTWGEWFSPHGGELKLHEQTDGSRFDVGELSCWVRRMDHHPASLGIRISDPDGSSMAYLGDTDLCDAAIELCSGVDVAIVECSWTDDVEGEGHLNPSKVAAIANEAKPETIILTHLYPETLKTDVVTSIRLHGCKSSVVLAEDGMGVALDPPSAE